MPDDLSRGGNVEASAKFNSRDHLRAMPGNEMKPVRPAAKAGHFDACSIWKNQSPNNPESVLFAPHLHR